MIDRRGLVLAALMSLGGCSQEHPRPDAPVEIDCGASSDRPVDVLWVVQTKSSTYELRSIVGSWHLPTVMSAIQARVTSRIRMGITTGSVGPAEAIANGCRGSREIFDGVLIERGDGVGRFYGTTPDELAWARGDLLTLDNDGCGNSVFEAAVRALAPHDFDLPITFAGSYHGDVENAGFTEPGDIVLIVIVTMEDDCSWNETIGPGSRVAELCPIVEDFNCCVETMAPTSRYIDAFQRLEERLGVDIVLASYTIANEPDVPVSEWRTRETPPPTCAPPTPIMRFPWRILEVSEALAPHATSRSGCGETEETYRASAEAIADLVVAAGCER